MPLLFVFLFINPLISLVLFFIVLSRLIYLKLANSAFDKFTTQSQRDLKEKLDKMSTNIKNQMANWEVDEILKLTKDFPDVFIDFMDEKNEYIITYRNKTAYFQNIPKMREWLTSFR